MLRNRWFMAVSLVLSLVSRPGMADVSPPAFRAYGFYATQKTGGDLFSGGISWNPRLIAIGPVQTGGVLGAQLLKDQAGTLVPAIDFGVSIAVELTDRIRLESQLTGVLAPFEGSSLQGSLSSSSATVGGNLLWDRPFLIFDGVWIGGRQWLAADSVTEYRIGGSFRL